MKVNELIIAWIQKNSEGKSPREVGKYWASDIYPIFKGYMTPQNFIGKGGREIDKFSAKMMVSGIAMENMLKKIFSEMNVIGECQTKKEIKINENIVLVVRPDFIFKDFIIEAKFPFKPFDEIPPRYAFQLECEYRAFYLPVYLGIFSNPFDVRMIEYTPSKLRWKQIINLLVDFDQRLKVDQQKNKII